MDSQPSEAIAKRTTEIFTAQWDRVLRRTDKMFAWLMVAQWAAAIVIALVVSPYTWAGRTATLNVHVYAAIFLGGGITCLPFALAFLRPGKPVTRYVIAGAQMLWSALLIHLTGGRIETHFHVFGSLAFLAFYRDWRVLVPATLVVAADHFVRGVYWPESVYGLSGAQYYRFLEHAWWVVFEDFFLATACLNFIREMKETAQRQAEVEALSESEKRKTVELDGALTELRSSQDALVRTEKLAAVGQLAASVSHELRNPLAAVRNANTFLAKKLGGPQSDPKVTQFLGVMDRELGACSKIITELLDFARDRPPQPLPCALGSLVDDAISLLPRDGAKVKNEVTEALPIITVDKDQFRQVLINLIQNAVEALPSDRPGEVRVSAEGGDASAFRISIADNGCGMPREVLDKVFEPLFTTKSKGTGLGLAIVSNMIKRHGGTITVESEVGRGTRFVIELPATAKKQAA